jgi:hypothetical protein
VSMYNGHVFISAFAHHPRQLWISHQRHQPQSEKSLVSLMLNLSIGMIPVGKLGQLVRHSTRIVQPLISLMKPHSLWCLVNAILYCWHAHVIWCASRFLCKRLPATVQPVKNQLDRLSAAMSNVPHWPICWASVRVHNQMSVERTHQFARFDAGHFQLIIRIGFFLFVFRCVQHGEQCCVEPVLMSLASSCFPLLNADNTTKSSSRKVLA